MTLRRLAALTVALPLLAALPADAAPKPKGCRSHETRGDAGLFSDSSLDITGGDLALGRKEVVAVLRVAGTDAPPLGNHWRLAASGNGVRYEFERRAGAGSGAETTSVTVGGQPVAHTFTLVGGTTLVWRFARKAAPALAKPKVVWHDLAAQTSTATVTVDSAAWRGC